jgi:lipopolysaccharide biosynthesis glycosyltransferase
MKVAIAMALSNSHTIFLDHLIKSVKAHNPDFNNDFYIFNTGVDSFSRYDLAEHNKAHLNTLHPFIYKAVDYDYYYKCNKWQPIYYSLECFNLRGYDYVIYWGADMLCLKPLTELWQFLETFGDEKVGMTIEKRRRDSFNNGGMIIPGRYCNERNFYEMINLDIFKHDYDHVYGHDQKIYNIYFKKHEIAEIPQKFNTLVTEAGFLRQEDIIMLHYFLKPTQENPRSRLAEWQRQEWDKYTAPGGVSQDLIY